MRLGARILRAVAGVNQYEFANEFQHNEGSADTLYIQLVNLDHNQDGGPAGISYQPDAGSTLEIVLGDINTAAVVTLTAIQPFSADGSIWSGTILTTHDFGTGPLQATLTENGVIKTLTIIDGIQVFPSDPGRC